MRAVALLTLSGCLVLDGIVGRENPLGNDTTLPDETMAPGPTGPTTVTPNGAVSVTITGGQGTCVSKPLTLVAAVSGATDQSVAWSSDGGGVDTSGVFTSASAGLFKVRATSNAAPSAFAEHDVTVASACLEQVAGIIGGAGTADDVGDAARFFYPSAVAMAPDGTAYVVDDGTTVRQVSPSGQTALIAGDYVLTGTLRTSGSALGATCGIMDIAYGPSGDLFVTEGFNCGNTSIIVRLSPAPSGWTRQVIAGSSDGAEDGVSPRFHAPSGIAATVDGLYVVDTGNRKLRFVTYDGVASSITGQPNTPSSNPNGVVDGVTCASGDLGDYADSITLQNGRAYVTFVNGNNSPHNFIASVDVGCASGTGDIVRVVGREGAGVPDDGPFSNANVYMPVGITSLADGVFAVVEFATSRLRRISLGTQQIDTLAGGAYETAVVDATPGTSGRLYSPNSVAARIGVDTIVVTDGPGTTVRAYDQSTRALRTLAGRAYNGDNFGAFFPNTFYPSTTTSAGDVARFAMPSDAAINGRLMYLAEQDAVGPQRGALRRYDLDSGLVLSALMVGPSLPGANFDVSSVALAPSGTLWVGGFRNSAELRHIDTEGNLLGIVIAATSTGDADVINVAPSGTVAGAPAYSNPALTMNAAHALAVAPDGTIYIADRYVDRVRQYKFGPGGLTTAHLGSSSTGCNSNQGSVTFNQPAGLALSGDTLFVAESGNHVITRININATDFTQSTVARVAGSCGGNLARRDGTATSARLATPSRIALTPAGDLYIAEGTALRVLRNAVSGAGMTVETLAGRLDTAAGVNLSLVPARLNELTSLALDGGDIYFTSENAIFRLR